jgi:hypothetical protein
MPPPVDDPLAILLPDPLERAVEEGAVRGGFGEAAGRDEPLPEGPGREVPFAGAFLGVGFFGAAFDAVFPAAASFAGIAGFLVAAFQPVPQAMQERSSRPLLVSHRAQRQAAVGRAAGRLAEAGEEDFRGGAGLGRPAGPGPGAFVGGRRLSQAAHVFFSGALYVSQSAHCQLADGATSHDSFPRSVLRATAPPVGAAVSPGLR